jgi:unsaturated rhamnogalacturonyl hydrolase
MRKIATLLFVFVFSCNLFAQSSTWGVKFSNAIVSRYTPTVNTMTGKGWEYSNGIILHGMEKIYLQTKTAAYLNYIKAYVDAYVSSTGAVSGLGTTLDKIQPGILCLFLYEQTGQTKYKTAATNIRNYLLGTPSAASKFAKTPDGGYWHKNDGNYNNVMMLDGIYMAHPFLVKYGALFNDTTCFTVASFQTLLLASHVMPTGNLPRHAWDYSKTKSWANRTTGNSPEVWSRGTGWFAMALVDILRYFPKTHRNYAPLLALYQRLAAGILATRNASTGLWYQVMDKSTSAGNYVETSGSGMFIYALKKGIDNAWISSSTYLPAVQDAWTKYQTKIANYSDGKPQITSFAPAMGAQNSYSAYVGMLPVKCPSSSGTQHPHGYCGALMAASVMEYPAVVAAAEGSLNRNTIAAAVASNANNQHPDVYPVPFHDELYIKLPGAKSGPREIQLRDLSGRIITREIEGNSESGLYRLAIKKELQNGVYLLCLIEGGKQVYVRKLVKQ